MDIQNLGIDGVWLIKSDVFVDDRGSFSELFKSSSITDSLKIDFPVRQINQSVSASGVVRGIHWALRPPGQKKFVTCTSGKVIDFFVDLRSESQTFGRWGSYELTSGLPQALLLNDGIGHAFLSLEASSTLTYLVSEEFNPEREKSLNPLDNRLQIPFLEIAKKHDINSLVISEKDTMAPNFEYCLENGEFSVT